MTHPPAVPSLATPAPDGKLEGVSENKDICIMQSHLKLNLAILTSYSLFITNKGTRAWTRIGEGELGHTPHGVHLGPCSVGTK